MHRKENILNILYHTKKENILNNLDYTQKRKYSHPFSIHVY